MRRYLAVAKAMGDNRRPSFQEVCSALVKDPWCLPLSEIGKLNPVQVCDVYFFRKEDDNPNGALPKEGGPDRPSSGPKETFWKVWKGWRGLSQEATEKKWQEHLEALRNPPPPQ